MNSRRLCMGIGIPSRSTNSILLKRASSIFALSVIRSHGFQPAQLQLVTRTTTVASLLYTPFHHGGVFNSAEERSRLERLIARLRRKGFLSEDFPAFEILVIESLITSCTSRPSKIRITYCRDDTSLKKESAQSGHNL